MGEERAVKMFFMLNSNIHLKFNGISAGKLFSLHLKTNFMGSPNHNSSALSKNVNFEHISSLYGLKNGPIRLYIPSFTMVLTDNAFKMQQRVGKVIDLVNVLFKLFFSFSDLLMHFADHLNSDFVELSS